MLKFYRISYITLLIFTAIIFGLVVADSFIGNGKSEIFTSVWVVFLLTAFAVLQLFCLFMMKPALTLKKIGFYLLHFGLVLFLGGSFIFYIFGETIPVYIPVRENVTYSKIQRQDSGEVVDLGFGLGVDNFTVEKYETEEDKTPGDKYYEADLIIEDSVSLRQETKKLIVNKPVRKSGWKIYLMNYNLSAVGDYELYLLLKHDPGERITDTGIFMTLIGAFIMCFHKKKEADEL